MELMKYYNPGLPAGSGPILHALQVCRVLTYEQLITLNHKYSKPFTVKVIRQLERAGHLFIDNNKLVSIEFNNFYSTRANIAAFWVFLEWSEKAAGRYSRGNYPTEIIFTLNNTNFEIIVCITDGIEELGHLSGRKKPIIPTKYIVVFLDEKMLYMYDKDNLPDYDFLFASIKYDYETQLPIIKFHQFNKDKEGDINENESVE